MQAVAPAHLMSLLITVLAVVLVVTASYLILKWVVVRRNRRRARGFFLLGFSCGLVTGRFLRGRRHVRRALRVEHFTGRLLALRSR